MKLYTRSGDDGTTGLFGGGRVSKDHPRVTSYGIVDELNAAIGLAAASCAGDDAVFGRMCEIMIVVQSRLFEIGADLATPEDSKHEARVHRIEPSQIEESERWIDEIEGGNEPMTNFVLPGGTETAARLHLARTICRRAERAMVALGKNEPVNELAIVFINRLSDLLFAMARRANRAGGVADIPWESP